MSNYTKTTNFAVKDTLASGNPAKIIKGSEINSEYDAIATAIATSTPLSLCASTMRCLTDTLIAHSQTGAVLSKSWQNTHTVTALSWYSWNQTNKPNNNGHGRPHTRK